MARSQTKSTIKTIQRQNQRKRPQERPQRSLRKSTRLKTVSKVKIFESKHTFPSPSTIDSPSKEVLQNCPVKQIPEAVKQHYSPTEHEIDRKPDRKRKRSQAESPRVQDGPAEKRTRNSLESSAVEDKVASDTDNKKGHSINHWIQEGNWPRNYFEEGSKMSHLFARKRSPSLRRNQWESGSITPSTTTPSDQKAREEKTAPYKDPQYGTLLATQGSYMDKSDLGIIDTSKSLCRILLDTEQNTPENSLFRDDLLFETCRSVQDRNEARVIRDITPLICPSAEVLAIFNSIKPRLLIDSVNQGWNNSIPATKVRPQPDYSVGFSRSAFTNNQLQKLSPYVGGLYDASYFMATYYMYFPFFTCEVKCGASALDIADRQNAHSMTLAVRGVIELFRLVKREDQLHQKILAFSISHDDTSVRIYGHYALIEGKETTFYRHPIRNFNFTDPDGKDKWTAYRFTKNIYDKFMPDHLEKIRSAIDAIPANLSFEVSLDNSLPSTADTEKESELSSTREIVESGPSSQDTGPFKKPKLRPTVMLQQEIDWLKQQLAQEREESKQQLAREKDESKQRHTELMVLLKEELKEQKDENKRLIDMLQQKLS